MTASWWGNNDEERPAMSADFAYALTREMPGG